MYVSFHLVSVGRGRHDWLRMKDKKVHILWEWERASLVWLLVLKFEIEDFDNCFDKHKDSFDNITYSLAIKPLYKDVVHRKQKESHNTNGNSDGTQGEREG